MHTHHTAEAPPHLGFELGVAAQERRGDGVHVVAGRELLHADDHVVGRVTHAREADLRAGMVGRER